MPQEITQPSPQIDQVTSLLFDTHGEYYLLVCTENGTVRPTVGLPGLLSLSKNQQGTYELLIKDDKQPHPLTLQSRVSADNILFSAVCNTLSLEELVGLAGKMGSGYHILKASDLREPAKEGQPLLDFCAKKVVAKQFNRNRLRQIIVTLSAPMPFSPGPTGIKLHAQQFFASPAAVPSPEEARQRLIDFYTAVSAQGKDGQNIYQKIMAHKDPSLLLTVLVTVKKLNRVNDLKFDTLLEHPDLNSVLGVFNLYLKCRAAQPLLTSSSNIEIDVNAIINFPNAQDLVVDIGMKLRNSEQFVRTFACYIEDMKRITPLLHALKPEFRNLDHEGLARATLLNEGIKIEAAEIQIEVEAYLKETFNMPKELKVSFFKENTPDSVFYEAANIHGSERSFELNPF